MLRYRSIDSIILTVQGRQKRFNKWEEVDECIYTRVFPTKFMLIGEVKSGHLMKTVFIPVTPPKPIEIKPI